MRSANESNDYKSAQLASLLKDKVSKVSQDHEEELDSLKEAYEVSIDECRKNYYNSLKTLKISHEDSVKTIKAKENKAKTEANRAYQTQFEAMKAAHQ